MDNPLISIIVPVYNGEKYICETIERITKQTWENLEIIIINDGSTDNTRIVLENYKEKNNCKKIQLINTKNQGAANARNIGVEKSSGTYIQFLDADDFMDDNKLENQVKLLQGKTQSLVFCTYKNYRNHKIYEVNNSKINHSYQNPSQLLIDFWKYRSFNVLHSYLISKALLLKVGNWEVDISNNDDGLYMAKVILEAEEIIFDDSSFVYYVFVNNSLSKQKTDLDFISRLNSYQRIREQFLTKTKADKKKVSIFDYYYWCIISELIIESGFFSKILQEKIIKQSGIERIKPRFFLYNSLKLIFGNKNVHLFYPYFAFRIDRKILEIL